ncbi:MAG TPA: dihydropteroate synthase [Pyrinomonadaceae bacterium]|jgi:dihydropteroate synthase
MSREWKIAGRTLRLGERTLLMGVLNVTPDSFSDGGRFYSVEHAVERGRELIAEGADIVDIGGESTRPGPGAEPVTAQEELRRIIPVVEELASKTEVVVSVDTTKAEVAREALRAGAAIINDISALRFDFHIADEVAQAGAGLVLMHSRGTPATMHRLPPVPDVLEEVARSLRSSISMAERRGVQRESIVIDPGIGFGKSQEQNLELIARLDELSRRLDEFPILIGTSRKSFIGRMLDGAPVGERIHGTMATVTAAVLKGAHIVRVHDVRAARDVVRVADAVKRAHKI